MVGRRRAWQHSQAQPLVRGSTASGAPGRTGRDASEMGGGRRHSLLEVVRRAESLLATLRGLAQSAHRVREDDFEGTRGHCRGSAIGRAMGGRSAHLSATEGCVAHGAIVRGASRDACSAGKRAHSGGASRASGSPDTKRRGIAYTRLSRRSSVSRRNGCTRPSVRGSYGSKWSTRHVRRSGGAGRTRRKGSRVRLLLEEPRRLS